MALRTNTLDFDELVADPASPNDGQVWHNNTTGELKARLGGVTYVIAPATAASKAVLLWGDRRIQTSVTPRYLSPGYDDGPANTTEPSFRMPSSATLRRMRVRARLAGVGAATLTYTLRVNGVASALVVAMPTTSQDGSDLVNAVAVSAGDLVSIEVTKSASISTTPFDIVASLEVL